VAVTAATAVSSRTALAAVRLKIWWCPHALSHVGTSLFCLYVPDAGSSLARVTDCSDMLTIYRDWSEHKGDFPGASAMLRDRDPVEP